MHQMQCLSLSLTHTLHIFSHADEKVVSTQIRHDKTHEYGMTSKQFP